MIRRAFLLVKNLLIWNFFLVNTIPLMIVCNCMWKEKEGITWGKRVGRKNR